MRQAWHSWAQLSIEHVCQKFWFPQNVTRCSCVRPWKLVCLLFLEARAIGAFSLYAGNNSLCPRLPCLKWVTCLCWNIVWCIYPRRSVTPENWVSIGVSIGKRNLHFVIWTNVFCNFEKYISRVRNLLHVCGPQKVAVAVVAPHWRHRVTGVLGQQWSTGEHLSTLGY